MRTIYIYLSWTGWIWFAIAMTYLIYWKKRNPFSHATDVTSTGDREFQEAKSEAKQPDE